MPLLNNFTAAGLTLGPADRTEDVPQETQGQRGSLWKRRSALACVQWVSRGAQQR